jgi:SAM-dependent methyltransferase
MTERDDGPLAGVARYYTGRIREFGVQARGVDWNGPEGQVLRFEELCRLLPDRAPFSVCDLGCGYGALLDFLRSRYGSAVYHGLDVSEAMVEAARARYAGVAEATFDVGAVPLEADYCLASGIFNVRAGAPTDLWDAHVADVLAAMDRASACGFAFNCLTSYSDPERMRADLYYGDPCKWFDFCKRSFSRNVALLHDYGLYEFTILVRKDLRGK